MDLYHPIVLPAVNNCIFIYQVQVDLLNTTFINRFLHALKYVLLGN